MQEQYNLLQRSIHRQECAWPELCGTEGNMVVVTIDRENPKVIVLLLVEGDS